MVLFLKLLQLHLKGLDVNMGLNLVLTCLVFEDTNIFFKLANVFNFFTQLPSTRLLDSFHLAPSDVKISFKSFDPFSQFR